MKLFIHQLKLEFVRSRWLLALWAVVLAWMWYGLATTWYQPNDGLLASWLPPEFLNSIVIIAVTVVTLWVHGWDLYRDPRAMWHTRPMPSWTLYGAKSAMVFLSVILPILLMILQIYPAIAGWRFTLYLLAEVFVWCVALHVFVSFINLQFDYRISVVIVLFAWSIPWIFNLIFPHSLRFINDVYWWFCYILILFAVALGLIFLALFKKNTNIPAKRFIPVGIALATLHFVPMALPWYKTGDGNEIANKIVKVQRTKNKSVRRSVITSGIRGSYEEFQYALPDLKPIGGVMPMWVIRDSEQLALLVDGKNIETDNIWLSLGIWDSGSSKQQESARAVFPDYVPLDYFGSSDYSGDFRLSINQPQVSNDINSKVKLSNTFGKVKGSASIGTFQYHVVFRCNVNDHRTLKTEGGYFSWRKQGQFAFFEAKIIDLDLMTVMTPHSENNANAYGLSLLLVNHKHKEWLICNVETLSDRDKTGFNYTLEKIDFHELKDQWQRYQHSNRSKKTVKLPSWEEWLKDAEVVAIRSEPGPNIKVELDLDIQLPQEIADKINHK